jgi:hypothetical protein
MEWLKTAVMLTVGLWALFGGLHLWRTRRRKPFR